MDTVRHQDLNPGRALSLLLVGRQYEECAMPHRLPGPVAAAAAAREAE